MPHTGPSGLTQARKAQCPSSRLCLSLWAERAASGEFPEWTRSEQTVSTRCGRPRRGRPCPAHIRHAGPWAGQ
eukprot:9593187-Alexandrium_andersonii.AAC.1